MGYDTQLASTLAPLLMSLAPQILHMCVVSHIHVISIPRNWLCDSITFHSRSVSIT